MENRFLSRGKRKDNGEWVEGYLIVDEKDYSKYFIGYVLGTNEDGAPHDLDVVQVDPSTICRCTGLKDKNGKLIWECPNCGNRNQDKMSVARRTCGYIGTQFWNQGRTQEIKDRVLHL